MTIIINTNVFIFIIIQNTFKLLLYSYSWL